MPDHRELSSGRPVYRRAVGGLAAGLLGASVISVGLLIAPLTASAAVPHDSCPSVSAGGSSGWCGLYPGNAPGNVRDLGQVTVSPDGVVLLVQTVSASTGTGPATSSACLVDAPPSAITHRLQDRQCARAGGVWFSASGDSINIDLAQYPQFLNTRFTVQVGANLSARDANGDAFYNNVAVDTVAGGGVFSS